MSTSAESSDPYLLTSQSSSAFSASPTSSLISQAWTGEPFSYEGKYNHITNATVSPVPYQKPRPKIRIAASGFVLANGDGHGFRLCSDTGSISKCIETLEAAPNWPLGGEGAELTGLLRLRLREIDPAKGLQLSVDRRLCDRGQTGCLIDRW